MSYSLIFTVVSDNNLISIIGIIVPISLFLISYVQKHKEHKLNTNKQEIEYIQQRLEKFYFPLSQRLGDYHKTIGHEGTAKFWTLLEEKSSFLYLTDNTEIKETYEKLIALKRKLKVDKDLDNVVSLRDKLLKLLNQDIEILEIRLNELTR